MSARRSSHKSIRNKCNTHKRCMRDAYRCFTTGQLFERRRKKGLDPISPFPPPFPPTTHSGRQTKQSLSERSPLGEVREESPKSSFLGISGCTHAEGGTRQDKICATIQSHSHGTLWKLFRGSLSRLSYYTNRRFEHAAATTTTSTKLLVDHQHG